jgi:hypothetical protein
MLDVRLGVMCKTCVAVRTCVSVCFISACVCVCVCVRRDCSCRGSSFVGVIAQLIGLCTCMFVRIYVSDDLLVCRCGCVGCVHEYMRGCVLCLHENLH